MPITDGLIVSLACEDRVVVGSADRITDRSPIANACTLLQYTTDSTVQTVDDGGGRNAIDYTVGTTRATNANIANHASQDMRENDGFSLRMRLSHNGAATDQIIASKHGTGSNTTYDWRVYKSPAGVMEFRVRRSGGAGFLAHSIAAADWPANTWKTVTWRVSFKADTNWSRLYLDGKQYGIASGSLTDPLYTGYPLWIGARQIVASPLYGKYRWTDFLLWNRPLTYDEATDYRFVGGSLLLCP